MFKNWELYKVVHLYSFYHKLKTMKKLLILLVTIIFVACNKENVNPNRVSDEKNIYEFKNRSTLIKFKL